MKGERSDALLVFADAAFFGTGERYRQGADARTRAAGAG
jgi:hypothetical protein